MTAREDRKSLKRKPRGRRKRRKGKIFDPYARIHPTNPHLIPDALLSSPVPSSLPRNFVLHILPLVPSHPHLLSFDSLPNEGCFVTVEYVSRLSFEHVYLAFFSRVCHTASFFAVSFLPPLFSLRFIPTIFDVAVSSYPLARHPLPFFPLPFPFPTIPLPSSLFLFRFTLSPSLPGAHTQTYSTTSRFTSLGDMSFSTLVARRARVSPSHQPPPRHGANLKIERRGWLRLCRRRTRRDGWLMDRVSFFISFLLFFFFLKISFIVN